MDDPPTPLPVPFAFAAGVPRRRRGNGRGGGFGGVLAPPLAPGLPSSLRACLRSFPLGSSGVDRGELRISSQRSMIPRYQEDSRFRISRGFTVPNIPRIHGSEYPEDARFRISRESTVPNIPRIHGGRTSSTQPRQGQVFHAFPTTRTSSTR